MILKKKVLFLPNKFQKLKKVICNVNIYYQSAYYFFSYVYQETLVTFYDVLRLIKKDNGRLFKTRRALKNEKAKSSRITYLPIFYLWNQNVFKFFSELLVQSPKNVLNLHSKSRLCPLWLLDAYIFWGSISFNFIVCIDVQNLLHFQLKKKSHKK